MVEGLDKLELKRQLLHLFHGSAIALMVLFLKPLYGLLILIPLGVVILILHLTPRLAAGTKLLKFLYAHFERKKDIKDFPFRGAIFFGYGIAFPIVLLDAPLACAVILILSVGDSVSTLVGRSFGKTRIGDKSFEGFLGFIAASWAVCAIIIDPKDAFFLALIGGLIELISKLEDNIIIPVTLSLLGRLLLQ